MHSAHSHHIYSHQREKNPLSALSKVQRKQLVPKAFWSQQTDRLMFAQIPLLIFLCEAVFRQGMHSRHFFVSGCSLGMRGRDFFRYMVLITYCEAVSYTHLTLPTKA